MHSTHILDFLAAVVVCVQVAYLLAHRYRRQRSLPPGPPGYPIIGNVYDVGEREWVTFKKLSEHYNSSVIYLNMCGTPLIVLNDICSTLDLFHKRSAIYSDRPRMPMLNELVGFHWNFAFMPYGKLWRERRKLFHKEMQPPASLLHRSIEVEATRGMLKKLLDTPDEFDQHLRHMTGTIILSIAYGLDIRPKDDPYVDIAEKALHALACAGNPGAFLVDCIPLLKYVPEWLPGAGFKRKAREWRRTVDTMRKVPFDCAKRGIADRSTNETSIACRVLEDLHNEGTYSPESETILQDVLATSYAAGSDTTVSILSSFILAMTQNPKIQARAQHAVDVAIGKDRLPDFTDQDSIPYVDALMKEALRWNPVAPLAVPHRATTEDEYNGYRIPAGSIVVSNTWAMLRDESLFGPDTETFNPERFLNSDGTLNEDVRHPDMAFGIGRRQCPGVDIAESSMWIAIASILACFDILKAVDENGVEIEPSGEYMSGTLCYPRPFKCRFRAREERRKLVVES